MLFSDKLITKFICCIVLLCSQSFSRTLLSDLCCDYNVNSTDLTVQCSWFLLPSVYGPKVSIALERIALPYLPLFVILLPSQCNAMQWVMEWVTALRLSRCHLIHLVDQIQIISTKYLALKSVYTEAFKPVSGNMGQFMAVCGSLWHY